ncbi:MAG: hypothetical protein IPH16_18965 [Haliscomenobacter sp.]|nr:hypothetical protein [Haliscomenobacter sp.]
MAETHPLFPSGEWEGFYLYPFGAHQHHQHRMEIWFQFNDGIITGGGSDDINVFIWRGTYDTAALQCAMVKYYPHPYRPIPRARRRKRHLGDVDPPRGHRRISYLAKGRRRKQGRRSPSGRNSKKTTSGRNWGLTGRYPFLNPEASLKVGIFF